MEIQQALGKQIQALRRHEESGQPGEANGETPATAPAAQKERGFAGSPTPGGLDIGRAVRSQGHGGDGDSAIALERRGAWTEGRTAAGEPSLLGAAGGSRIKGEGDSPRAHRAG